MASIQERLQIKREPLDKWSIREQLCLASAVAKSGDQNWMSVSRALKPFGDSNRPSDWFHQKNCAAQYGSLLENVETPKRKKRTSGPESVVETPIETILRKLTQERIAELDKLLVEEKAEYIKLQDDMTLLRSGTISEDLLDRWCKEIDEEEKQKVEETIVHTQWLKEREIRKQEIERAWRPVGKVSVGLAQKRKTSETLDTLMDIEMPDDSQHLQQTPENSTKPALSPLLTSLLKSPSQSQQNVTNASILHSAITNQRSTNTSSNPTIASLLNSATGVNVSPSLQHLVSTAIAQEPSITSAVTASEAITNDILEEAVDSLPNIKVEDLERSILSSDDPLPEIKNEEVEVIISDLIQNADIVSDPEQHLQLDDNEDIITNLDNELQELCNEEEAEEKSRLENPVAAGKSLIIKSDPFEFEEDPEISQVPKPTSHSTNKQQEFLSEKFIESENKIDSPVKIENLEEVKLNKPKQGSQSGSVEIVEVVVMEEAEIEKQLNKTQIQNIVHSVKQEVEVAVKSPVKISVEPEVVIQAKECKEENLAQDTSVGTVHNPIFEEFSTDTDAETKPSSEEKTNTSDTNETSSTIRIPEYSESFFDDINIEVNKLDKLGKAKRDYSRTKKKDTEKEFDILLAVEKVVGSQYSVNESTEDSGLDEKDYGDGGEKKFDAFKPKIKIETDRSNSPWTEEEEMSGSRSKRRYSTPATPVDSVPNSPASSSAYFEDDRDYKNWKKSIMLIHSRLTTHKYSSLFLKPITDDQAPGYHSIVFRPMDLQTIRKNIENGSIRTTLEFQRELLLMSTNAIMYNKTNGFVYNMAQHMQQEIMQQIQIFLQAQQGDAPQRRETRTSEPINKRKRGAGGADENSRSKKRKED